MENRFGSATWSVGEVSVRQLPAPDNPSEHREVDVRVKLEIRNFVVEETHLVIQLDVKATVQDHAEFALSLQGKWDLEPYLSADELDQTVVNHLASGYRLDEVAAVANFKLEEMAAQVQSPAPFIPQEKLDNFRNEIDNHNSETES